MLFVVSTPVGNLADITLRALEVLRSVDLVLAEDTRHSGLLLKHYEIKRPFESLHAHTSIEKRRYLLAKLKEGQKIALVTDAGTPGLQDPGAQFVAEAYEAGIKVVPVPGASALLAAVAASPIPINQFLFLGFMPKKKGRRTAWKNLRSSSQSELYDAIVIYESPYRIGKTLDEIALHFGPHVLVSLYRELTKKFEEILWGEAADLSERLKRGSPRGEFVVIIHLKSNAQ